MIFARANQHNQHNQHSNTFHANTATMTNMEPVCMSHADEANDIHLQHYIATNNAAAVAIDDGRYEDAIYGFSASLSSTKDLLQGLSGCHCLGDDKVFGSGMNLDECMMARSQPTRNRRKRRRCLSASLSSSNHSTSSTSSSALMESISPTSPPPSPATLAPTSRRVGAASESATAPTPFLYASPIELPHSLIQSRRTGMLISVISIFNLALSYQLCAMQKLQQQQQQQQQITLMLGKATSLYELAYTLVERENLARGATFFSMAIINNLGMIHQAMGRECKANKCFGHLLSTIMAMVYHGCTGAKRIAPSELEGFLRNTSYLVSRNEAAPAA